MFETTRREGALELRRSDTEWLSTGWEGGRCRADAAHSVTVPDGWDPDDTGADVAARLAAAGFDRDGPVLLTGVATRHARVARLGPVEAFATVGLSNPADLPVPPADGGGQPQQPEERPVENHDPGDAAEPDDASHGPGTVNVVVGTTRSLPPAALANLVAVAAEAKATTLLELAGVPGTTSDAVVVATDPDGDPSTYSGSATAVGDAARACVREAVTASLRSRYPDGETPAGADVAEHGVVTDRRAEVSDLDD